MLSMLAVKNSKYIAFFHTNEMDAALNLRKTRPELKHARVTNVIQANPSQIFPGAIYERGENNKCVYKDQEYVDSVLR